MDHIISLIDKREKIQDRLKAIKCDIENEISKTEMYQNILGSTLGGDYEISEKDAHKHAINVCLKNIKKKTSD